MATVAPSTREVKNGCLRGFPLASTTVGDACHSYQPRAGTRQRRVARARANAGLSATDSTRALIIRAAPLVSLDQLGTSPHVSRRSWRLGSSEGSFRLALVRTTGACFVGAMLWSGRPGGGSWGAARMLRPACAVRSSSTSNSTTSSSGLAVAAYRPHMHLRLRTPHRPTTVGIDVLTSRSRPEDPMTLVR